MKNTHMQIEINVHASSKAEAFHKKKALETLGKQFNVRTLNALAKNGKNFLNHPTYGAIIRQNLGL